MTPQELLDFLDKLEIQTKPYSHEPFDTCEISKAFHEKNNMAGVRAKNLFLRNKNGKKHFMLVLPHEKQFDKPKFKEISTQKCGMADHIRLYKYLGIMPGSVSPLALINDKENEVKIFIDKSIMEEEVIHFHPLDKTQSIPMKPQDLIKFLETINHEPEIINF